MNDRAVCYVVRGRVQGVGFRHFVWKRATVLGVTGWVRNRPDGCVEAVVWGDPGSLADLKAALLEGPPWSSVAAVEEMPCPCVDRPEGPFFIRR